MSATPDTTGLRESACPWCHHGDPHPMFSNCAETNAGGLTKRDEFAAERREVIIEALSWHEDSEGRWGYEKAAQTLYAHEAEWCGVDAAREQGRAEAGAAWACMCGVSEADHASVDPPHMFHSQAERDDLSLTVAIEALAVRAVRYGSEYVPLSQLRALLTADHAKALDAVKAAAWDEGVDYCEDIAGVGYNPVGTHDGNPYRADRLTTDTP